MYLNETTLETNTRMLVIRPPGVWTKESIFKFYSNLGFFADRSMTDIFQEVSQLLGTDADPNNSMHDLILLGFERHHACCLSPRLTSTDPNTDYADFLSRVASLTHGLLRTSFQSEPFSETTEFVCGNILWNQSKFNCTLCTNTDFLDLDRLVPCLNSILEKTTSPKRLELAWDAQDDCILFFISSQVKIAMQQKRLFPFWEDIKELHYDCLISTLNEFPNTPSF